MLRIIRTTSTTDHHDPNNNNNHHPNEVEYEDDDYEVDEKLFEVWLWQLKYERSTMRRVRKPLSADIMMWGDPEVHKVS